MRTINLIPREGKRETQSRRRLLMMAGLGALFVLLLAAITVWRQGAVDDARDELEAQLSTNQALKAEVAALAAAEDIQNQFNAEAATLSLALANDVSWGRLLVDLGRVIPDKVWVTSYSGSVNRFSADSTEDAGDLDFMAAVVEDIHLPQTTMRVYLFRTFLSSQAAPEHFA